MARVPPPGPVAVHVADPYRGYVTRPFAFFRRRLRGFEEAGESAGSSGDWGG